MLLLSSGTFAQDYCKIKMLVLDANQQAVSKAHVLLKNNLTGTITNEQGYFELNVPKEFSSDTLTISHLSFIPINIAIDDLMADTSLHLVNLQNMEHLLAEVIVDNAELTAELVLKKAVNLLIKNYHREPAVLEVYYSNESSKTHTADSTTYHRGIETILLVSDEAIKVRGKQNFRNHEEARILQNKVAKEWEVTADNWPGSNSIRHLFKKNIYKYFQSYKIGFSTSTPVKTCFSKEHFNPNFHIVEIKTTAHAIVRYFIKKDDYKIMRIEEVVTPETTFRAITKSYKKDYYWYNLDTTIVEFQEINDEVFLKSIYASDYTEHRLRENDAITYYSQKVNHLLITGIRKNTDKLPKEGEKSKLSKSFYGNKENSNNWEHMNKYIRFIPDELLPDSVKTMMKEMWKEEKE